MVVKNTAADRFFDPDRAIRSIAGELFRDAANRAIVCPHGHVDPRLFADPNITFGSSPTCSSTVVVSPD